MAHNDASERVSRLPLLIMAALIVVAALVTIALAADQGPQEYPAGTPEAALQRFVSAALDEDEDAMFDLLTEERRAACVVAFEDDVYGRSWSGSDLRAELDDMTVEGDTARASVRFREDGGGGPFDSSSWDYDRRFTLERVDGAWLVDRAGWPYPFDDCTR